MKCEFSETQYAFGLVQELVKKFSVAKGYIMRAPSTVQEAKVGYDIKFKGETAAQFFQFKIPQYLTRSNALYWNEYRKPYYLFKIWPNSISKQHNLLVDLSHALPTNHVYYISPAFITNKQFDTNYQNNSICDNSVMVPCSSLKTIKDNDEHCITYSTKVNSQGFNISMHSEFQILDDDGLLTIEKISDCEFLEPDELEEKLKSVLFEHGILNQNDFEQTTLERICNLLILKCGIVPLFIQRER